MSLSRLWPLNKIFKRHRLNSTAQSSAQIVNTKSCKAMSVRKTLKEFGYGFNKDGQLRKLSEDGEPGSLPFQFNVSDNHSECQQHYEELGSVVTDHVYKLLEEQHLTKLSVPEGSNDGTFVFVSKDFDKKDQLLVLIHGSGVVRAGQWARSLIINESLHTGTQLPYIRKAVSKGFGVLVMNTNDNLKADGTKIPNSGNPEEHAVYVWNKYIQPSSASVIAIVAHSYGGVVTLALADKLKSDFEQRVKAIAFTDSVHGFSGVKVSQFLKNVARNWVASKDILDTPIKAPLNDVDRVSAGHQQHEMTSHSCIESVFKFISENFQAHRKS